MKIKSQILFVVCCLPFLAIISNPVFAHCRMKNSKIDSLPSKYKEKLLSFHKRIRDCEHKVVFPKLASPSVKPAPTTESSSSGGNNRGYGSSDIYVDNESCHALFEWLTDFYNSAFCHLKHVSEGSELTENVDCVANYPGSPEVVKKSMTAYKIATDDEPLKAALKTATDDLVTFIGKQAICDKPITEKQFKQEYMNLLQAKMRMDREIDEYEHKKYGSEFSSQ